MPYRRSIVAAVTTLSALVVASPSGAGAAAQPVVAPYLDLGTSPALLYRAVRSHGLGAFTAGFVLGRGCTPRWDNGDRVGHGGADRVIRKARRLGATPIVSFGGAAPAELATTCSDVTRLSAAYRSVVRRLHLRRVDFDIEGDGNRRAVNVRRFRAIRALERSRPDLEVSVTIAAVPHGLPPASTAILREAKHAHARVDLVNLMTMDYYDGTTGMAAAAISAATAARHQVRRVWPHRSYRTLGITPMIGRNDDASEVFTLHDAQRVSRWALAHHVGRLSFWQIDRDRRCAQPTNTAQVRCSGVNQSPLQFTDTLLNAANR